jgi:acyl-CoA dehydrogenase
VYAILRTQDTAELFFEDVRVPRGALLGKEGRGFMMLMSELPQERLMIGVGGISAAEARCDPITDHDMMSMAPS